MAAFGHLQPPASIRRVAFGHLQQLADRLLRNLITNQSNEELCRDISEERKHTTLLNILRESVDRECNAELASWWKHQEDDLRTAATNPEDVPPLSTGLTPVPALDDIVRLKLLGLHFLVRLGASDRFTYFSPDEHDNAYSLAPYCYPCVRDGLELRGDGHSTPRWVDGLNSINVEGKPGKIGSHLAIRRGLCQYIPDLFGGAVRPLVGYSEIDALSRNRSSVYLAINDPPTLLEHQPPSGNPAALLIIQSAIPNIFGSTGYIAFEDALYNQHADLSFTVDAGFFKSLFDLLFRHNRGSQLNELLGYARLLSEITRVSAALAQDVRRDERSAIGHSQRRVWSYVRQQFDALKDDYIKSNEKGASPQETARADHIRMASILIDHLGLSSDLGIDRLDPSELKGKWTDLRELSELLPLVQTTPSSEDNWLKSIDSDPVQVFCSQCRPSPQARINLPESVITAIWFDLAENATKHGSLPNGSALPTLVWGCGHRLAAAGGIQLLRPGPSLGWHLDKADTKEISAINSRGMFVGVLDFAPIPAGLSSIRRPDRMGIRLLIRLMSVLSRVHIQPIHVGFCGVVMDDAPAESQKSAFAFFPIDMCVG